jgi:transketolase C-terminal domain/subunit
LTLSESRISVNRGIYKIAQLIKWVGRFIGLPDEFLDTGALPTLHDMYGISAEKMGAKLKAWLS